MDGTLPGNKPISGTMAASISKEWWCHKRYLFYIYVNICVYELYIYMYVLHIGVVDVTNIHMIIYILYNIYIYISTHIVHIRRPDIQATVRD
jgi:hypothetical protein